MYILSNSLNITGIIIFLGGNNFILLNSVKVNLLGQAWYLSKSMNFPNKAVVEIPCALVTIQILVLVAVRVFDVLNFIFPCKLLFAKIFSVTFLASTRYFFSYTLGKMVSSAWHEQYHFKDQVAVSDCQFTPEAVSLCHLNGIFLDNWAQ